MKKGWGEGWRQRKQQSNIPYKLSHKNLKQNKNKPNNV